MHSVPPETPAADNAAAARNSAVVTGVAGNADASGLAQGSTPGNLPATGTSNTEPFVPLTAQDVPSMYTYDPWERLNRFTYRFNARFDEAFFLPVANS
jgi:hypothetical protein